MASIWEELVEGADAGAGLLVPWPDDERYPLADVLERAERTAAQLLEAVDAPRRVGILMMNGEPFLRAAMAAFRVGAAAVPLALPVAFGGLDAYLAHLRRIALDARLDVVLLDATTAAFAEQLRSALDGVAIVDADRPPRRAAAVDAVAAGAGDGLAVVQYTSGSTSAPKGVPLTHDNVSAGLDAIRLGLEWTADDAAGIWLPLFHDMGLFGSLHALVHGSTVVLWRPTDFVRRTGEWVESFAASPATVVPSPNFAYDYLVRAADEGLPRGLDLSRWRVALNGAEAVQRTSVERFERAFEPLGVRPETMMPVYGLAEATLAVSFSATDERPRFETVARDSLGEGQRVARVARDGSEVRQVACVGTAVPGLELRVADGGGTPVEDGVVGEIQVRGPSVMRGYLGVPAERQPFTADGWLRTGDLGFAVDGRLHVAGRLKDIVILHGQNYYPEDVEEIVRQSPAMTRRHCVAVGLEVDGAETMVVLFETKLEGDEAREAAEDIRLQVASRLGLTALQVLPVPPRAIPHTPSGKVQRRAARSLCERQAFEEARRGWAAEEVA